VSEQHLLGSDGNSRAEDIDIYRNAIYVCGVKTISLYVEEPRYRELKALAKARGRPVAELLREAMVDYLARVRGERSMLDLPPHSSGKLRRTWRRHELLDEMRRR